MSAQHDYHIAAEADVSGRANRQIWYYFIMLGILLFATIVGLIIMYQFSVDYEKKEKIGLVNTKESIEQMALSDSYLSGKRGLFQNKKHAAIDVAIDRFVSDVRKAK